MTDELAARRARDQLIWQTYKGEIFDWCGHWLALEITAGKLGLPISVVSASVAKGDPRTFL